MKLKLSNLFFIVSLVSISLTLVSVASIFAFFEHKQFRENMASMENSLLIEKKLYVRQDLENTKRILDYNYAQRRVTLDTDVKSRVDEAYNVIENIYNKFHQQKSKSEVISIIKETLREQRFFKNLGYYFLFDLDGVTLLSPIKPELEGTKELLDFKDLNGHYPMRTMIESVQKSENGTFFEWTFYKPNDIENQALKRGFARVFAPYEMVIVTAEYLYSIEEDLQVVIRLQ